MHSSRRPGLGGLSPLVVPMRRASACAFTIIEAGRTASPGYDTVFTCLRSRAPMRSRAARSSRSNCLPEVVGPRISAVCNPVFRSRGYFVAAASMMAPALQPAGSWLACRPASAAFSSLQNLHWVSGAGPCLQDGARRVLLGVLSAPCSAPVTPAPYLERSLAIAPASPPRCGITGLVRKPKHTHARALDCAPMRSGWALPGFQLALPFLFLVAFTSPHYPLYRCTDWKRWGHT